MIVLPRGFCLIFLMGRATNGISQSLNENQKKYFIACIPQRDKCFTNVFMAIISMKCLRAGSSNNKNLMGGSS
jgi:hypothetical protein